VDILNMPSMLKMDVLSGNPSYYAAKDPTTLPDDIAGLVRHVEEADCFLIVSPEYNHTIPPVLTHLMNMVGCSKYANKASGTVCYSGFSTPAGGARCAVALRPFLSELGCLPVSKQVILPDAVKLLSEDGVPQGDHGGGAQKQLTAMLEQCARLITPQGRQPRTRAYAADATACNQHAVPRMPMQVTLVG
jgi:NAD(P)H-dependent FMN reductase